MFNCSRDASISGSCGSEYAVESLLALKPDLARSSNFERRLGATGISVFARYMGGTKAIEVRSFAPSCGVNEDPGCGSGNGSIAVFLRGR